MTKAYMLINTEIGFESDVVKHIRNLSLGNVKINDVSELYGVYDIIVAMEAPSIDDIKYAIPKIRKYGNVRNTTTMFAIDDSTKAKTSSPTSP
jgi:uncharacterized protein with GYD domain